MTAIAPFDLGGPLPTGTTVLEASAGTGKTYTVGALVARFVAEGTPLERILVVTFGRQASQELRERVRDRLVDVVGRWDEPPADDPLRRALAATGEQGRARLVRALADFDAATLATTHEFCKQVLDSLGVAGDSDSGAELVENLDDLVVEVVDDLYVRRFATAGAEPPPIDRALALQIGRQAVGHPDADLAPADAPADSIAALRHRFARAVRDEIDRRKRARGILGYDDLLSRVAEALRPAGSAARARMLARWSVVLVDEFQDTDPVQWSVVSRAFGPVDAAPERATVVLIGDPKQAIYAFRGGDVVTYLSAAGVADGRATLDVNRRSDGPLVASLSTFLAGAALGDERILVRPVTAAESGSRLRAGGRPLPPFRLRLVRRSLLGQTPRSAVKVGDLRPVVARDVAADIARTLGGGVTFAGRAVRASDIAVLVGTHAQAELIRTALTARAVPSVLSSSGSVYATPAATDWQVLLDALEQPHRSGLVRAAALTPFLGLSAADLDEGGDLLADDLGALFHGWADLLATRGVAAVMEVAAAGSPGRRSGLGMPARLLAQLGGERRLTDLRQIGENLQAVAAREGLGLVALGQWLRHRREGVEAEAATDRLRRLDSDAAAVRVMTVHVSKGLQFPIVYLPFAADQPRPPSPGRSEHQEVLQLHDERGHRVLDVGGARGPGYPEHERRAKAERAGEALRLLYVGLTRAQSQVVTWWAPFFTAPESGLNRMLFGRTAGSSAVADTVPLIADDEVERRVRALAAAGGPVVEFVGDQPDPPPLPPAPGPPPMSVARFSREVDLAWRRASYSSLSAAGQVQAQQERRPGVGSEPEVGLRDDEAAGLPPVDPGGTPDPLRQVVSPMAELPTGAAFGTVVHAVLERADVGAADLAAELLARCREETAGTGLPATVLAQALTAVLRTPLGPLADECTLADIGPGDRLAELGFELPLAGGDVPTAPVLLGAMAPLLRRHLGRRDPLRSYADRLAAPEMSAQVLRGYLTGSLDLVARLPGPRFLVADYKTNWLATEEGEAVLTAWHYRPQALIAAMLHSDYPLQALLYGVALHRFLRWRQPGYDPDRHLGGVLYLYVRGMSGPDTPRVDGSPCGVFAWKPPAALTVALSDLLDGETRP